MKIPRNDIELKNVLHDKIVKGMEHSLKKFSDSLEQSFVLADIPSPHATMYEVLSISYKSEGGITDIENTWEPHIDDKPEPELVIEYNQDKLDVGGYYSNRHNSPIGTPLGSFPDLLIHGQGGRLFGETNSRGYIQPTREPRDFWSIFENNIDGKWENWIEQGFKRVGL